MFPLVPFIVIAYFVLYVLAHPNPQEYHEAKTDLGPQLSLDAWLSQEKHVALHKLLQNIAPFGENAKEAIPGTVIASPSQEHPDYYYQWIRDAAITLSTLVHTYELNSSSPLSTETVSPILQAYTTLSYQLQRTSNPSGSFDEELSGLGEPKFHIDGRAYTENWGRPQRDGPALRALTLIRWLRAYNSSHPWIWSDFVSSQGSDNKFQELYEPSLPPKSVIKADLEYVAKHWNKTDGFDLWEEVQGMHFFTAMVQLKALTEGADLANRFGDIGAQKWYLQQANTLQGFIKTNFWSEEKRHLIETVGTSRSGLDCAIFLGSLHGLSESSEAETFPPWSDEVLLTLQAFVKDQKARYPINQPSQLFSRQKPSQHVLQSVNQPQEESLSGTGLGRYPEDVYDGYSSSSGNPWFLCTSSASHILSLTASHIQVSNLISITERNLPFWQALLHSFSSSSSSSFSSLRPGIYASNEAIYIKALDRLKEVADEFLAIVRTHSSAEGTMSEQFDATTGFERGARDLTWSYGAFLEAVRAREVAFGS